jgi:hypothetical protein
MQNHGTQVESCAKEAHCLQRRERPPFAVWTRCWRCRCCWGAALTLLLWAMVLFPLLPPLVPLAVCSLTLLEMPMAVAVALASLHVLCEVRVVGVARAELHKRPFALTALLRRSGSARSERAAHFLPHAPHPHASSPASSAASSWPCEMESTYGRVATTRGDRNKSMLHKRNTGR